MDTTSKGFIFYQKRKEKTYAYRRINGRDPITKKVKCISQEYLGVYNEKTKKITKPRTEPVPKNVFSYGSIYLIEEILNELKLPSLLLQIYGEDWYKKMKDLLLFKCLTTDPMYLFQYWKEDFYLPEQSVLKSPSSISNFILNVGEASKSREDFFYKWSKLLRGKGGVLFDLTSISTYCEENEYCEKGYNKDRDQTGQVNIGMIYSKVKQLPIAYRSYPGSLKDVTTIKNLMELFKSLGLKVLCLVLDRGFYSIQNLKHLKSKSTDFIVSIPQNRKIVSKLILSTVADVSSPINNFIYNGDSIYCYQAVEEISDIEVNVYLYCDEKRQAEEKSKFMLKLDSLEKDFLSNSFVDLKDATEYIEDAFGTLSKCFQLSESKNRIYIDRNEKEINKIIAFKGKFVLATNSDLTPEETLDYYRKKDQVEKVFHDLKNELKERKFRSKNSKTFEGKMFLNFLCLIVISHIRTTMRENDLYKDFSIRTMFATLEKLKVFELHNGKKILTEITAKQKKIYKVFGLKVPQGEYL